jgi:hypothetical protein
MAAMSSNLHNLPNSDNLINSTNFASTGNVIMQNRNGGGMNPGNINKPPSNQFASNDPNGRYKKKAL